MQSVEIQPVRSDEHWKRAREIRTRVFIEEQACSPEEEWDGHDATSRHLLAWLQDDPVGVARWRAVPFEEQIVAKLERFAVLKEYRGKGFGRALVRATEQDARRAGFTTYLLYAQQHLQEFYEALGYQTTEREPFEEAGISHVEMVKRETVTTN